MNEFTTVFEYTAHSIRADALGPLALVLVCLIIGVGSYLCRLWRLICRSQTPGPFGGKSTPIPLFLLALGVWFLGKNLNLFMLAASDISGNSRTAEGMVHVSQVQAYSGHSSGDQITIGGQKFEVNYSFATPGYKQSIERGGALREGVYARVQHVNGVMLKVEVRTKQAGQESH